MVVTTVVVAVVPVGVVIGILVSGTVELSSSILSGTELFSGSNPSGGSGILVSHSCSLPP